MGRPSLAEQRRAEILGALERCLLRDGLANTSVQAVAAEAGCQRTLVHHYFGTLENLVGALLIELAEDLERSFQEATKEAPALSTLLAFLFQHTPSRANELIAALRASGIESAQEPLARMYESFASSLCLYLRSEFPEAPASRCGSTAFAIVCLSMSRFQLTRLGVSRRHIQSLRSSAEVLIDSLR